MIKEKQSRVCPTCEKEYAKPKSCSQKSWGDNYKVCSLNCRRLTSEWKNKISLNRKGKHIGENHHHWNPASTRHSTEMTVCGCGCGKEFKKYDSKGRLKRFFNFYHKPKGYKRSAFSEEWKNRISKSRLGKLTGERHWNWKGGKSRENHRRETQEYKVWRKAVYERDYWTCADCKVKQRSPVAHHIKNWNDYPELRYNMNNGVTLCRSCHKKRHQIKNGNNCSS